MTKMFMMKFLMAISTMSTFLKTPMSLGILLLIYTTLSTMVISKNLVSSWMAMITFLMFIGGLLILFMYMSSIASNEKFKPSFIISLPFLFTLIPLEEMLTETQMNDPQTEFNLMEGVSLSSIYNEKTMLITMMLFIYMLLSMVMVTSIIKIFKGPLRSSKY